MQQSRLLLSIFCFTACVSEPSPTGITSASLQAPARVGPGAYEMIDLGTLGGSWSVAGWAGALNNSGQVVGQSATANGESHAFLWDGHAMIDLGTTGEESMALAINDRGQVIGFRVYDCGPWCAPWHGVMWDHGVMTDLGFMPSAINNVGQVIGYQQVEGKGFLWDHGVKTDLGSMSLPFAINNAGQIVGSNGDYPVHAFLWQNGVLTSLGSLGGGISQAVDINSRGQIVGNSSTSTGEWRAFLWYDGTMTDLGTLGGNGSTVEPGDAIPGGINDRGQIAGSSMTATGSWNAFVWDRGAMIDVGSPSVGWVLNNAEEMIGTVYEDDNDQAFVWSKGVLTVLPALGSGGSWPDGINNAGQIVGSSGGHAVLWQRRRPAP